MGRTDGWIVSTAPVSDSAVRALTPLATRSVNFEPIAFRRAAADPAWRADVMVCPLPSEPPGPPLPDGPFAIARAMLIRYEFADPSLVRAVYDRRVPFDGRDMLLVVRFYGLRFHVGVRVGGTVDEVAQVEGRPAHRFRWHYHTLEGHLERGQMTYELVKWLDDGRVELRVDAYSQTADISNPIIALGVKLFGRERQLTFYDRSLARTRRIVEERAIAR